MTTIATRYPEVFFDRIELSEDCEVVLGTSVSTTSVTRAHADHNDLMRTLARARAAAALAARRAEATPPPVSENPGPAAVPAPLAEIPELPRPRPTRRRFWQSWF